MTDLELCQQFLDWQATVKRRSTWTTYKGAQLFEKLVPFLLARGSSLSTATEEDLTAFIHRPRPRVDKPSDGTVAAEIWKISKLFEWLADRSLIASNKSARLLLSGCPTVHDEDPKPVPLAIWRRLWFGDLTDTERVAFGFGYFCGLRRAEVMGLRVDHLNGDRLRGVIRKGGGKHGFPYRSSLRYWSERLPEHLGDERRFIQPLNDLVLRRQASDKIMLLDWHDEVEGSPPHKGHEGIPTPYSTPSSPNVFNARLNTALVRNGLVRSTATPHMLRHSFCTYLLQSGVPLDVVSRLAGHAKIQTTMRYVKALDDPLAQLLAEDKGGISGHERLRFEGRNSGSS